METYHAENLSKFCHGFLFTRRVYRICSICQRYIRYGIFKKEVNMGARIKPVQPTAITDKKIVQQVISEIHRKPTKKELAQLQMGKEVLKRAMAK
jgi:hypothetical protein